MIDTIELASGIRIKLKGVYMRETYSYPGIFRFENYSVGVGPGEERNNQILKYCKDFFLDCGGYYLNLPDDYVKKNPFLPNYFNIFWLASEYDEIGNWSELVITIFSNEFTLIPDLKRITDVINDIDWEKSAEKFEIG